MEYVWFLVVVAACVGLWFVAYRLEPHWSSRDGRRFMCTTQELFAGQPAGQRRETQVSVLQDGTLRVTRKKTLRRRSTIWSLVGKSPDPPKRMQVYLAQEVVDGRRQTESLAIRIPARSRVVAVLDELVATAS